VRIEVTAGDELSALPAPLGLSPTDEAVPDERYSLEIDPAAVLRTAQPVGVAGGLTSLAQLAAATASAKGGTISLWGAQILDSPRYAWRGPSVDLVELG
jgi:N-acetyl-beta-hexosaminidase